jgi:hypothetical protein
VLLGAAFGVAIQSTSALATGEVPDPAIAPLPPVAAAAPVAKATLPAGATVMLMTNDELSTKLSHVGDQFGVTVLEDVTDGSTVVIPKGTPGRGEVTFATNNGGFGKPGILGIALRHLDLNGTKVPLDGHYREEGANKNGATVATWFAVGVFSGFIRGKPGVIPRGRELKAHTGEDIAYVRATLTQASAAPAPPVAATDQKPSSPAVTTASTSPNK